MLLNWLIWTVWQYLTELNAVQYIIELKVWENLGDVYSWHMVEGAFLLDIYINVGRKSEELHGDIKHSATISPPLSKTQLTSSIVKYRGGEIIVLGLMSPCNSADWIDSLIFSLINIYYIKLVNKF